MRRKQFLNPVEQLRAGQHIEESIGVGLLDAASNAFLLLQGRAMAGMHEGWLLGWLVTFGDFTVSPWPAFPKNFQSLALILAPFGSDPFLC
jgi:hypothetical protein